MATLINNAGVQHYANKMVLAENRKVGSKSLPTALNDIDNLIDEMKTQFDAEYGSALDMKLENNENAFSLGTGTNVDKRSEVENSFTDVELSGNSLVNIAPNYEINWTHSGTWLSNFLMTSTYQNSNYFKAKVELKPNTTYSIIVNVTKNTSDIRTLLHNASAQTCYFQESMPISAGQTGVVVFVQKTISDFNALNVDDRVVLRSQSGGATTGETIIKDIIILEGDYTNKPLPQYFEGLKSVGQKEDGDHKISISSKGKNLFNISDTPTKSAGTSFEINKNSVIVTTTKDSTNYANVSFKIPLKPLLGKRISGRAKIEAIEGSLASAVVCSYEVTKGSFRYLTFDNKPANQLIPNSCYSDYLKIQLTNHNKGEVGVGKVKYSNIQIEINDFSTDYESHKEDKKEISLNEPLRGLPNGIRDTIEKVNGEWKIVRRCSEVVLNGSEPWALLTETDKEKTIGFRILNFLPLSRYGDKYKMVVCDRFPSYKHNLWKKDYEGITTENNMGDVINDTQLQIIISKSKLSSQDVAGFKQWLSQNPIKVVYELETPIIENISPITLQCWKNGTISIDEVLPVETTHTVALNKPAQIKRNIEELTVLRKRVQALEDFYDQIALEQAHQLSLISNSIELDYNI